MKYEWLATARFISWRVSEFLSLDEARGEARRLKATGANTVITFGCHYRFEHVDKWPQIKENLRNIVTACHEIGLRVVEHHSATFVPPEKLSFIVDGVTLSDITVKDARTGEPPLFEQYQTIMLCCNNPEFRRVYFGYVLDLARECGIDALMSDDIEFCPTWHVCGCEHCRSKFGGEIPAGDSPKWGDFGDAWFRDWLRFRMRSVGDYYVDLRKAMDGAGLDIPLLGCLAGASTLVLAQEWGMTGEEFARGVDLNFYEAWFNCSNLYSWRAQGPEISYYLGIGRRFGQPMFTLDYTRSEEDLFFMWAFNLVMGDRLWLNSMPQRPQDMYIWEADHQELFTSPETLSNAALLFSRQTRDVYGGYGGEYYLDEWLGWSEMLVEANIACDTILDADLTGDLGRYDLLILPNAACLSDAQVDGVRRFMDRGGRVIATHETGFFDETGARRSAPAFADWLANPPAGFVYHSEKVGATQKYPLPDFGPGVEEVEWTDTRYKGLRAELLAEVLDAAGPLPWRIVEGGEGVLANVHRVRGGATVAHILNVSPLDLGGRAVLRKDAPPTYDPLALSGPVTLGIRVQEVRSATLYSPDNAEPVPLDVIPVDGTWHIRIGAEQIRRYGAIRIE